MRVPLSWLAQHADVSGLSGRQVANLLVGIGFEVEGVETVGDVRGALVVGKVLSIEELEGFKKPIRFCQVEVGQHHGHPDTPGRRGIVCGARNFSEGDLVVVALPGTTLPGDFTIATRETYGRVSDGMICSQRELGLGEDHSGIIVLDAEVAGPGDDAFAVLGIGDEVLEVAITPDRGYAMSIRGIAREVSAAQNHPFDDPGVRLADLPEASGSAIACATADPNACDLFVTRTLDNFNPQAPTPSWMSARLQAAGMRSVSLAVDVTNYVMIELGQPLHAFDADKVAGGLTARRAKAGETLETLDHVKRTLVPQDLVIADESGPLSLAGVMGGFTSEISDSTTRVVIEAAHFDAVVVAQSCRRHKLSSEASRRFERGVDRMLAPIASALAAQLLIEYGHARYCGTVGVETAPEPTVISFDPLLPSSVAGRDYSAQVVRQALDAVGCQVNDSADLWVVQAPSWRPDLQLPIDLVEEVLRIDGYDNIPSRLPIAPAGQGLTRTQKLVRRVGLYLAGRGLVEVHNYPFIGSSDLDALGISPDAQRRQAVALANPLREEQPLLRTTLLPGLFGALARNGARGFADVSLYEIAPVVIGSLTKAAPRPPVTRRPSESEMTELEALLPQQPRYVAAVSSASNWQEAIETTLSLAQELGVTAQQRTASVAPWHPGRCAQILVEDVVIGTAGEIAPRVLENLGLPARSVAFEIDLDLLFAKASVIPAAPRIWTFPIAKEDIALVVREEVAVGDVQATIANAGGELLESVALFDVYRGGQVADGHKSLAFALRMRAADRTLTAEEVAQIRHDVIAAVSGTYGATLRA